MHCTRIMTLCHHICMATYVRICPGVHYMDIVSLKLFYGFHPVCTTYVHTMSYVCTARQVVLTVPGVAVIFKSIISAWESID